MLNRVLKSAVVATVFLGISASSVLAELKSETVTYTVGDRELSGYLVYDDAVSGKRPGVIVVHEWWGHDEYARSVPTCWRKRATRRLPWTCTERGALPAIPKTPRAL